MAVLKEVFSFKNHFLNLIFKNLFFLYASEIFAKGLKILIFLYLVRSLGPSQFGIFEYLFAFIGMFFLLADFGMSNVFIREYQQKDDKLIQVANFFVIKFSLTLSFTLLSLFGYFWTKKYDGFLMYLLIVFYYFFSNLESFFETFFLAVQKSEKRFLFNFVSSLLLFLIIFLGLRFYYSLNFIAFSYLISSLVGLIVAYFLFKKDSDLIFNLVNFNLIKDYFKNGLPLAFFGILGFIFFSTDKIILAYFRDPAEIGYYSLATRILSAFLFLPYIFSSAFYPYLAQKAVERDSRKSFNYFFNILIPFSSFLGLILSFFIFVLSYWLVMFLGGVEYLPSVYVLQLFCWLLVFLFPTNFLDYFLISHNKQWLDFFITLIPALLNIFLNFVFIPKLGIFGAVFSSLFSQFINFVLTLIVSLWVFKKNII
jgi:O-antigen/teichoic acid export membrane protein